MSRKTIFEATTQVKHVNEALPLRCAITNANYSGGHVGYDLRLFRGFTDDDSWEVTRRYSEFEKLNAVLTAQCGCNLPLPPKKAFGNTSPEFVAERQRGLQEFIRTVLSDPILRHAPEVKGFFDPFFQADFAGEARASVAMFLRSMPTWETVEELGSIGWRINKHRYVMRNLEDDPKDSRIKKLLSTVPLPPTKVPQDLMSSTIKYLAGLVHPFVQPAVLGCLHASEGGLVVTIREMSALGSLRDVVNRQKPTAPFIKKGFSRKPKGLPVSKVQLYGRQILEAVSYLNDKSIPVGNLHAGNVLVMRDDLCQITDIETGVAALPSFCRQFVVQLRRIQSKRAEDCYCFATVLHEMSLGYFPRSATLESVPPSAPGAMLLEKLLTVEGVKQLPTLQELLADPFFATAPIGTMSKPSFKASARVKEFLQAAYAASEKKLVKEVKQYDQKKRAHQQARDKAAKEKEREKVRSGLKTKRVVVKREKPKVEANIPTKSADPPNPAPAAAAPAPAPAAVAAPPPAAPAPPPAPAAAPPAPKAAPPASSSSSEPGRGALLSSIQGFGKGGLKRAVTNDRSGPTI